MRRTRMRIIDLQGPAQYVETQARSDLQLHKTVFLGYTDIAAAGSRALMGLDMRLEYVYFPISGFHDCEPSCIRNNPPALMEKEFKALQILHCKYEEFSAILINTGIIPEKSHTAANAVIDLCIQSGIEKLIVLTTLQLHNIHEDDKRSLYENTFFTRSITRKLPLPGNTMIKDAFLCTLLQMIQLDKIPCSCLIIPGNKAFLGKPNTMDGSETAIKEFQEILHQHTQLRFNQDLSLSLIYRCDQTKDAVGVSSLYA